VDRILPHHELLMPYIPNQTEMTIEDIQNICKKFPYVTEDIKWETHLCYCVGEKIFIITSPDA